MKIELADPRALEPSAYNPRKIKPEEMESLRRSIREFGLVQPIILQMPGNRISGQWDDEKLASLLRELQGIDWTKELSTDAAPTGLSITGFDSDELERLLKNTDGNLGIVDDQEHAEELEDAADELQKKWKVGPGQAFALETPKARHLVVCGDCLIEMQGLKAVMIFTDPPWNIAIGGDSNPRHRQRKLLAGDKIKQGDWTDLLGRFANWAAAACFGDLYVVMGVEQWPTIDSVLRKAGFHFSASIIWVKDLFVLGRSNYHRRYEPIWYGWPEKQKSSYSGGRDQDDVWEIARPRKSPEHPTMKPLELPARAIFNSSRQGDVVLDPFLGSGTTLIAADQLGRKGIGIEIDPRFVAVSLQRMQDQGAKVTRTYSPSEARLARDFLFGEEAVRA